MDITLNPKPETPPRGTPTRGQPRPNRRRHALAWAAILAAGAAGAKYGYDFGEILGGPLLGVVLALNLGVCSSFLLDGLLERLRPARARRRG